MFAKRVSPNPDSPARWSAAYGEPSLDRNERRAAGVYYSPAEVVRYIVRHTLGPLADGASPRVLDPACGAGAFLLETYRRLLAARQVNRGEMLSRDERIALAGESIFGVDIDPAAVAQARLELAAAVLDCDATDPRAVRLAERFEANVVCGDALLSLPFPNGHFDAVVGNPPYVNIRQLAKTRPAEYLAALRERYRTARGNFDLYVLFIERTLELLREGGRWGLIVPNKIGGLDYARACRELLAEQTALDRLADLSECRVFRAAGVYPWVLVGSKRLTEVGHRVLVQQIRQPSDLERDRAGRSVLQRQFSAEGIVLTPARRRIGPSTAPLGEFATIQCGTAGYRAQQIAAALYEAASGDEEPATNAVDFIVSGNIDPYVIREGNVRYMRRRFARPRIGLDSPALSAAQRALFARPKLVVSGMSRGLEAAYDRRGLALGVQVYAITAAEEELPFLLALLNSRYLGAWFRERFAAKRLSGGYLAINKGQLAQLPAPVVAERDGSDKLKADIVEQASLLEHSHRQLADASDPRVIQAFERRIAEQTEAVDQLVYELYQVPAATVRRIEAETLRRAA
jgi:SAM-dependent methyltransferase